jgi:hypothetical protein
MVVMGLLGTGGTGKVTFVVQCENYSKHVS